MGGDPHDRSELVRFTGAPIETITLDVEIDAIDDLAAGDALAMSSGISSQLAALELFAFPPSSTVMQRRQQLAAGVIEIAPIPAPSLQFLWGPRRVLPVRLLGIQVTEEDFDQNLNPIRATVGISLRVLTYSDVAPDVHAYDDFLAYQRSLESLAARLASQRAAAHGSHT